MTCCVIALALAWQCIAFWRWLRGLLGIEVRERTAPGNFGILAANFAERLRSPGLRTTLVLILALEAGAAGAYVFNHRTHIGNEIAVRVFDTTGYAFELCRGLLGVSADTGIP